MDFLIAILILIEIFGILLTIANIAVCMDVDKSYKCSKCGHKHDIAVKKCDKCREKMKIKTNYKTTFTRKVENYTDKNGNISRKKELAYIVMDIVLLTILNIALAFMIKGLMIK